MNKITRLSGSEIVVRSFEEQDCTHIFGYPGGAVIPLFDAFYRLDHSMMQVEPSHEQNGVHAADGYARASGKVGVAITTSGPGATNAITGIANAYLDSVPLVVITGQVATTLLGKDSFQEVDITSITRPITKHNFIVKDVTMLAPTIREAFRIAASGRPGPVVIDIPKDVLLAETDYTPMVGNAHEYYYPKPQHDAVVRAAEYINQAERPVIYAGGGVLKSHASKELVELAEKAGIPIANSLMGLGSIPRDNPLSLGFVGMHGSTETNLAVINCDTLIAIGSRFSDRVTGNINEFMREKKIIHIDVDPSEFEKNIEANVHICSDIKEVLPKLTQIVNEATHQEWRDQIARWPKPDNRPKDAYTPKNIISNINNTFEDAYVVTEVGQHQMWMGQYWRFKFPGQYITSGGLGTMGFGLGAAIGTQLAQPEKEVVLIAGDGSFRMNFQELITVKKYNLPIKIFLFDNQTLGMVRQWQKLFNGARYAQTDLDDHAVDYLKLADAFDIKNYDVGSLEDIKKVLKEVKNINEPVLIHINIPKDEGVYPIVPAGKPIDEVYYG